MKSGRVIANSAEEFSVAAYESVSSIATLFQKEKICSASQMTSPSTPETLQIHKFVWSSTAEGSRIIALCFLSNGKESSHTQSYLERTCSHVVKEYVTSALFLLLCANCMKKYLEQNEAEDGFMKSASNCSHYVIWQSIITIAHDKQTLKVLTVFCETIFGFLEQSANRDSKWFSDLWKPNSFTHTRNWTWFPLKLKV